MGCTMSEEKTTHTSRQRQEGKNGSARRRAAIGGPIWEGGGLGTTDRLGTTGDWSNQKKERGESGHTR